jgi:hypothetical protein
MCLCVIGLFMRYMSSPASVFLGDTVCAPFPFPVGAEVQHTSQASYDSMVQQFQGLGEWFQDSPDSHTCLSHLCVLGKFPSSSPVPLLPDHSLSPNF